MATYDLIRELPLEVESYELSGLEYRYTPEFVRATTVVELHGGGEVGVGEDVTYEGLDHVAFQAEGRQLELAGSFTLESFFERLDEVNLWPSPPVREPSILYRRWAFESAALDLACRQAGRSLADVLGRAARPVNFVVSMRLSPPDHEGPETAERLVRLLERYPGTRFKLDPTNTWTQELVDELAATGAVDTLDLKGFYRGTPVDVVTDPDLYRMCAEAFPDAYLEDPDVTEETKPILDPVADRVTWDAPIHTIADVEERPWRPKTINIKPSRVGPLRELFALYDWADSEGISVYGGGQSELGPGRHHIQYLASIFHPDTPNDTAPGAYNEPDLRDGLPQSPLEPRIAATGFRRDEET
jgi:L-alanine-DL-glutamate epimerase-like enolase superfamily enzyme